MPKLMKKILVVLISLVSLAPSVFLVTQASASPRQQMISWSSAFLGQMNKYQSTVDQMLPAVKRAIAGDTSAAITVASQLGKECVAINKLQTSPSPAVNSMVNKTAAHVQNLGKQVLGLILAISVEPDAAAMYLKQIAQAENSVTTDVKSITALINTWSALH